MRRRQFPEDDNLDARKNIQHLHWQDKGAFSIALFATWLPRSMLKNRIVQRITASAGRPTKIWIFGLTAVRCSLSNMDLQLLARQVIFCLLKTWWSASWTWTRRVCPSTGAMAIVADVRLWCTTTFASRSLGKRCRSQCDSSPGSAMHCIHCSYSLVYFFIRSSMILVPSIASNLL
jgi:hypothetical protein